MEGQNVPIGNDEVAECANVHSVVECECDIDSAGCTACYSLACSQSHLSHSLRTTVSLSRLETTSPVSGCLSVSLMVKVRNDVCMGNILVVDVGVVGKIKLEE